MRSYVDGLCRFIFTCGVVALCLAGQAGADTVTLEASQDNTLYENSDGALSNGAGQHFFVGRVRARAGATLRRGLIMFDVAAFIPPGSIINSVELSLNASSQRGSSNGTILLHPVLVPWGEGTSTAPGAEGGGGESTPGDATWIHTHFDTGLWANPGGDFEPESSASHDVVANGPLVIASTAGMVTDVQGWLDNPPSNHGWLVRQLDEMTLAQAIRFDSRENEVPEARPLLTIEFSRPPLLISPLSGVFALTQQTDIVMLVNLPPERMVTSRMVLLDGVDATARFEPCLLSTPGTVTAGGQTFRCPDQNFADIGAGRHTFEVILTLDDETSVAQAVNWIIIDNTEP